MNPRFSSMRQTGSTRSFTTVDPERQGVLAVSRTISALAQSRSAGATAAPRSAGERQRLTGARAQSRGMPAKP